MELTSDNLFIFALKKYKYKEHKIKKKPIIENYINISSNIKKKDEKGQKTKIKTYFKSLLINASNISNLIYNSVDPFINDCFKNVEFLSITENYIKNLDFILHFPNLFYLDLYRNPLEDLTALNNKNIFGYLRLSIELYNEKKILNIYNLYCGILDIELKQKKYLKIFKSHNNHVMMLNNQILYFIDKIKYFENKIKNNNKKYNNSSKNDLSFISAHSNSNTSDIINNNENTNQKDSTTNNNKLINSININQYEYDYIPEKPIEKIIIKNPFLLKINKHFDDYENEISNKLTEENKQIYKKRRKTSILINNDMFKSKNLENNLLYLEHEKNKMIILSEIYQKITIFNTQRNQGLYYIGNIDSIEVNKNIDNIYIKNIKNYLDNHSLEIRSSIVLLISFIFYILGIITEKMLQAIINYIFEKNYGFDENKRPPDFSNFGNIHYLIYYYSTYDYIYRRILDKEKNVESSRYSEILNLLKMEKLIIKSNYLYNKSLEKKKLNYNIEFSLLKKQNILKEIRNIKFLKISKEFLILIQFLSDYIIYEKIEELLINNSYSGEYSFLIELKETIEETEMQINNINFLSSLSLSALKFEKNKKERIYNKFYFEKERVKKIKNKEFKNYMNFDLNKSGSMTNLNLNTSYIAYNLLNNSKSNFNNNYNNIFEDNEYNKSDDIDVDEFFYIDSVSKNHEKKKLNFKLNNKSNHKYAKKNKIFFESYNSSNNNSYEQQKQDFNTNNNNNIKLPSININVQSNQNNDFESLKQILLNPDFLSEHARYILKFEKITKKLQKKNKLKNNYKDKDTDRDTLYKNFISYDNNNNILQENKTNNLNKSKENLYIDSYSKENTTLFNNNFSNFTLSKNNPFDYTNYNLNKYTSHFNNIPASRNNLMKRVFNEKFRNKKLLYKDNNNNLNMDFYGVPQSFPGITLLNFGKSKSTTYSRNVCLYKKKKNPSKKNIIEKKSHKEQIMSQIKETVKNNILRNARRVAFSMYQ